MLFPLGIWLLRGERRISAAVRAMITASTLLLAVNIGTALLAGVKRAGSAWSVNDPQSPIGDPNEAAAAMLLIIALLIARHAVRPQWRNVVLASAAIFLLVMTASRSGLLALLSFGALRLPRARWRWGLVVLLLLAVIVPLVPSQYWIRMGRTLIMKRGTFEAFTSIIRFVTWKSAGAGFIHQPWFGVGYLGLITVSSNFNEFRLPCGAESYFLEMAADLGIVGLIALGTVIARLFRLGRIVRRSTAPGSMGHEMATLHTPLMVGLLVANLTESKLVGMVGLGQLALWTVLMVRAGHEAVSREMLRLRPAVEAPAGRSSAT